SGSWAWPADCFGAGWTGERVVSAVRKGRRRRTSERREKLRALTGLTTPGLTLSWAALGIGVHVSTASRWRRREVAGEPLSRRRGPHGSPLCVSRGRNAGRLG